MLLVLLMFFVLILIGLPIGVWALVVLSRADVKAALAAGATAAAGTLAFRRPVTAS